MPSATGEFFQLVERRASSIVCSHEFLPFPYKRAIFRRLNLNRSVIDGREVGETVALSLFSYDLSGVNYIAMENRVFAENPTTDFDIYSQRKSDSVWKYTASSLRRPTIIILPRRRRLQRIIRRTYSPIFSRVLIEPKSLIRSAMKQVYALYLL